MPIRKKINDAEENIDIDTKKDDANVDDSEYKQCPFCANKIKKGAIKCQYCHENLGDNKKISNLNSLDIEVKKDSHKGIIIMLVSVIVVLFIILMWYIFGGEDKKYKDETENYNTTDSVSYFDEKNSENVIDYNDALVDAATECINSEDAIWTAYDSEDFNVKNVQTAINNTLTECRAAITKVKNLGDFDGDNELNKGVLNILEKEIAYYSKLNELLPYIDNDNDNMYSKLFDELQELDTQLSEANDELITIQENFSKRHGFELEEAS